MDVLKVFVYHISNNNANALSATVFFESHFVFNKIWKPEFNKMEIVIVFHSGGDERQLRL